MDPRGRCSARAHVRSDQGLNSGRERVHLLAATRVFPSLSFGAQQVRGGAVVLALGRGPGADRAAPAARPTKQSRVDDRRVISGILHVPNCPRNHRVDDPPVHGHPNGTLQAQPSRRPAAQSDRAPVFDRLKNWRCVASRYNRLSCNDRAAVARFLYHRMGLDEAPDELSSRSAFPPFRLQVSGLPTG
jgi:hypothetical protein